jgi:hypothetical protein
MPLKSLLTRAAVCAVATTAAAALLSKLQTRRSAAALNATSHIVWGKRAFRVDAPDVKHTLVGALLNGGAMIAWSAVYELLPAPRSAYGRFVKAAGVTAASYVTDYYIVPKRLTPGFEARLTPAALGLVYAALGAGFLSAAES